MSQVLCPSCSGAFDCGAQDRSQPCWCAALPPLPLQELGRQDTGCYCPTCLQARLQALSPSDERQTP